MRLVEDANPFAYPARIWKLFRTVPHAGGFAPGAPGVVTAEAHSNAVRSRLRLQLRFEHGRVADARFRAYGCPTSIAVGAWLADWAIGKDARELAGLRASRLREELEIPEDRAHCALLGEDALRAVLDRLPENQSS